MANRSKVAVLRTRPETVLEDYTRLLKIAGISEALPKANQTALKINITWHTFYPACSTPPWQLDGVIRGLLAEGFARDRIYACHNRTVVVSARRGEVANNQLPVVESHGLRNVHLYEGEEWTTYQPKGKMLVLPDIFPNGIQIPKRFIGNNVLHLPTMKTHVFTTTTGAMKNAFGGLLHEKRHFTHSVIHETLVDLLTIQKEIHPGIFAVMDGTFAGDGPGPRCMRWHEKNVILASADQVAIDATAAKMMGFDPMKLTYIRLAHEAGLGCGNPSEIEIVGDEDAARENWNFSGAEDTFASRGQKAIYWGPLKPLEKLLLRTVIAPWSYAASILYHDVFWYPAIGHWRVRRALDTGWGRLFESYGPARFPWGLTHTAEKKAS
ncbi:MAG: DUF362 domain-containing protein [Deltaproteobacteria bacterium]|nr:DUF362 domain-containing protein [Deltaproteobacteria bacterium]